MEIDEKYRLHQSLGYQLSLTSRLQERRFEEQLKPLGLTRITWCILLAVEVEALVNPSDIAAFVGIDRTATSRALRQMETAGMVKRGAGKGDGRTTTVALTDTGHDLLARATPMARANVAHWQDKLTETETTELRRLMAKLRLNEDTALKRL
ncbi:MAG: winged helix-turn-helix transcriptional regulator [Marinosulfonomonas sp.]|nr:winged helix-turn-helix transcriptional regulator [Marinosulfonomonas sp.]